MHRCPQSSIHWRKHKQTAKMQAIKKKQKKHCRQLNKKKNLLLTAENMLQIQNTPPHF